MFLGRGNVTTAILALTRSEVSSQCSESVRSSSYGTIEEDVQHQQTPIIWAYGDLNISYRFLITFVLEKGHDQIVALLKYYANKRADSDVCSEYR